MSTRHRSTRRPPARARLRWPAAVGAVAVAAGGVVAQPPAAPYEPAARLLPPVAVRPADAALVVRGLSPDFRPFDPPPSFADDKPAGGWGAGSTPKSLQFASPPPAVSPPASKPSMLETAWADVKGFVVGKPADPAASQPAQYQFAVPQPAAAARPGPPGVYAGPPAYRWYGWGSTTPGANPYSPTGQYPQGSANWYAQTGATPGAFPVPVGGARLTYDGNPPAYAAGPPATRSAGEPGGFSAARPVPVPLPAPAQAPMPVPVADPPRPAATVPMPGLPSAGATVPAPPAGALPVAVSADTPRPVVPLEPTTAPAAAPTIVFPAGQPVPVTPVVGAAAQPAAVRSDPVAWQRQVGTAIEPVAFVAVVEKPTVATVTARGQAPEWAAGAPTPAAPRPPVVRVASAARPDASTAPFPPPLETAVKAACHGWARVTAITATGPHKLRIELTASSQADARVAFDQASQLPVLKPYEVQFEVKLEPR